MNGSSTGKSDQVDSMWQQYAAELLKGAEASGTRFDPDSQIFSLGSATLYSGVTNENEGVANASIYSIGNDIPAWSGSYTPQSDVFTSYWLFLNFAILGSQPNPEAAKMVRKVLVEPLLAVVSEMKSFEFLGRGTDFLAPQIRALRDFPREQMNGAIVGMKDPVGPAGPLSTLFSAAPSAEFAALIDADLACLTASDTTTPSSLTMLVEYEGGAVKAWLPIYRLPTLNQEFAHWRSNAENGRMQFKFELHSRLSPSPNASYGLPVDPLLDVPDPAFAIPTAWSLQAEFAGFGAIPIEQGEWFDSELIGKYKHLIPADASPFFGPKGSLSLLPQIALFGYRPRIQIKVASAEAYSSLLQTFKNRPSVARIGQFVVGRTLSLEPSVNDSNSTITFVSGPSDVPVLLGVICQKL